VFEAPIILSDDGFGVALIVPDIEGVDPELLDLLRRGASTESSSSTTLLITTSKATPNATNTRFWRVFLCPVGTNPLLHIGLQTFVGSGNPSPSWS